MEGLIIGLFCSIPGIVFIVIFIRALSEQERKRKEFNEEMTRRLPEVEYTEIISSSNGGSGTVSTLNSNGGVGFGSYDSRSTTKFLLVYKSGYKQIITIEDRNPLFNEYVALLKK